MAVLLLLLAIIGAVLVGDLVVENTTAGRVTVLQHRSRATARVSCWPWRPHSGSSLACWPSRR